MPDTKTLTRDMPNGSRVVATVGISDHGSGPYFSLTGELYEKHGTWSGAAQQRNGRDVDAGGQITDELLRAFPKLSAFAPMHLANAETGEPMHAEANGWYFYSREHLAYELKTYGQEYVDRHGTGYERACRILRVESIPADLDREGFAAFVDAQRDRWAREAREARAFVESLA